MNNTATFDRMIDYTENYQFAYSRGCEDFTGWGSGDADSDGNPNFTGYGYGDLQTTSGCSSYRWYGKEE